WLLVALFVVDWIFIGLDLAVVITLRVALLASVFALFVSTTTPEEFRLALERLGVPYRYAFSLSLAFQSVELLRGEWRAIREAQVARLARYDAGLLALDGDRGKWQVVKDLWRKSMLQDLVLLTVPAIVLTTRRAWSMTEAAYARGFEAPHRRPYRTLKMRMMDWLLIGGVVDVVGLLILA
ncbi:MAG: energy-coupling factor transporter transmembrane protein EcfT, partial [Anaerolineae bacterium]|nr:energy-coupling factor transporter transmembrane protein EcfT [Anaerolineae bacterium]